MKIATQNRITFFILLSSAIGAAVYLLHDYLSLIFVSLLYSILIYPLFQFFHKKLTWGGRLSSVVTVVITFFTIVLPLILIGTLVAQEALSFRQNITMLLENDALSLDRSIDSVNEFLASVPGTAYQITNEEVENTTKQIAGPVGTFLANQLISIGTSSALFVTNLFIFLVLVFFTMPVLKKLQKYMLRISPLPDDIDMLYVRRILSMTRAMIKGTFLVALIQGMLAGLLLLVFGVQYVLILTIIMTLMAIIPVLSTMLITIPIGIYFILTGAIVKGIIIILVQVLFISTIDNILRPLLASGEGHLHPALLLLAILGGLNLFGFLGIFYGPIILIFLTTSLEVYEKHYR